LLSGTRRFNELLDELSGIAPHVLSRRLKHLEREACTAGLLLVTCNSIVSQRAGEHVMSAALAELEQAVNDVAEQASSGVVGIGRGPGRGSGIVLADGRVVATNAHNLRGDEMTVVFADGRSETGRVVGVDTDLAVVAVDTRDARPLPWADGEEAPIRLGTAVFALATRAAGAASRSASSPP
jgi:hypothetical protein